MIAWWAAMAVAALGEAPPPDAGGAPSAPIEGLYRMEMRVRSTAQVPVIKRATSTTVTTALVAVRREGDGLVHDQRVCAIDIRSGNPLVRASLGAEVIAALPATVRTASVRGVDYVVDLGPSHLGYDPARGPLPSAAGDASVIDTEGDGRPGATVVLQIAGAGRFGIEVAQRSHAVLRGVLDAAGMTGEVQVLDFQQTVLGADHPFLRRAPAISGQEGSFVMIPVPAGTTCADL